MTTLLGYFNSGGLWAINLIVFAAMVWMIVLTIKMRKGGTRVTRDNGTTYVDPAHPPYHKIWAFWWAVILGVFGLFMFLQILSDYKGVS